MAYNHRALLAREGFQDIVGKALSGHAHDILVHAVGACTHDAAQSAGTKLQVLIECVDEGGLVLCVEHGLYFFSCLFVEGRAEPLLRSCLTLGNQLCIVCHNY